MLTGHGETEVVDRAVDLGAFGYLSKPFREGDLLPTIKTAIPRSDDRGERAATRARFEGHVLLTVEEPAVTLP